MNDLSFLRYLIDLIDSKNAAAEQAKTAGQQPPVVVNVGNAEQDNCGSPEEEETVLDRDDVFVPPLQAKLEMMKKLSGIEPKNQDESREGEYEREVNHNRMQNQNRNQKLGLNTQNPKDFIFSAEGDEPFDD